MGMEIRIFGNHEYFFSLSCIRHHKIDQNKDWLYGRFQNEAYFVCYWQQYLSRLCLMWSWGVLPALVNIHTCSCPRKVRKYWMLMCIIWFKYRCKEKRWPYPATIRYHYRGLQCIPQNKSLLLIACQWRASFCFVECSPAGRIHCSSVIWSPWVLAGQ